MGAATGGGTRVATDRHTRTDAADTSRASLARLENEAHGLADRLPDLVLEAMRISSTVAHGIHGRRRAGPGETFWQFRQYNDLDTATLIDNQTKVAWVVDMWPTGYAQPPDVMTLERGRAEK